MRDRTSDAVSRAQWSATRSEPLPETAAELSALKTRLAAERVELRNGEVLQVDLGDVVHPHAMEETIPVTGRIQDPTGVVLSPCPP